MLMGSDSTSRFRYHGSHAHRYHAIIFALDSILEAVYDVVASGEHVLESYHQVERPARFFWVKLRYEYNTTTVQVVLYLENRMRVTDRRLVEPPAAIDTSSPLPCTPRVKLHVQARG